MKSLTVFTSPSCAPCAAVKPLLSELSIPVRIVDVMERPQLAALYRVRSVPTFVLLDDDTVLKSTLGLSTLKALNEFIA